MLQQTWDLQVTDHPRSLQLLAKLDHYAAKLTPDQQWRLRYLNAWEAKYEGDYDRSGVLFKEIAEHSGNPQLADRAYAMLLSQYGITRQYTKAFDLANRLAARLPQVTDAKARYAMLLGLSQTMGLARQTDLAVRYARMAMTVDPSAGHRCYAAGLLVEALWNGRRLKPDSPELRQAFEACPAATEPLYNTALAIYLAGLYSHGGQPRKALVLLDALQARVKASGDIYNKLNMWEIQAWAFAALGEDKAARKAALAVVAAGSSRDFDLWLKNAYEVLYRIEKKQGNTADALDDYMKFATLDKAYLNDINATALAYQTVQQHVLAQKLETEKLSRQNAELRMRQALGAKVAEANRLYIGLLLMALVFGVLWMFRLKRSQLRFQRLSCLDSLTAVFNRQHFMGEATRLLRQLERQRDRACMVFIDLDHFKQVNDTYGHAAGDEVLRHVVATLRKHLRPGDLFGRLGGEEFGILLPGCTCGQAVALAERIRHAVDAEPWRVGDVDVSVSISMGVSATSTCGYDLRCLCTEADAALYRAKRAGRNRVATSEEDGALAGA